MSPLWGFISFLFLAFGELPPSALGFANAPQLGFLILGV
jgi:hypothetical protein